MLGAILGPVRLDRRTAEQEHGPTGDAQEALGPGSDGPCLFFCLFLWFRGVGAAPWTLLVSCSVCKSFGGDFLVCCATGALQRRALQPPPAAQSERSCRRLLVNVPQFSVHVVFFLREYSCRLPLFTVPVVLFPR